MPTLYVGVMKMMANKTQIGARNTEATNCNANKLHCDYIYVLDGNRFLPFEGDITANGNTASLELTALRVNPYQGAGDVIAVVMYDRKQSFDGKDHTLVVAFKWTKAGMKKLAEYWVRDDEIKEIEESVVEYNTYIEPEPLLF